ncbi:hypothetical protein EVAR_33873_1 [Eumeta japonica]|uniref:Uncharacterized protein n=1 Tax=Eumeta variegata TaxID=151549 RepID=A0A4C1X5T8_EUMVA|nr:hypothetical protein EVAR_33873_1 [Eumeta japonica]
MGRSASQPNGNWADTDHGRIGRWVLSVNRTKPQAPWLGGHVTPSATAAANGPSPSLGLKKKGCRRERLNGAIIKPVTKKNKKQSPSDITSS